MGKRQMHDDSRQWKRDYLQSSMDPKTKELDQITK